MRGAPEEELPVTLDNYSTRVREQQRRVLRQGEPLKAVMLEREDSGDVNRVCAPFLSFVSDSL